MTAAHRRKAVLLAAGLGTRLRPLTERLPKCLAPLAGRPILEYWLDALANVPIRSALINIHTFPELVEDNVDRINHLGWFKIEAAYEANLLGSAGTIAANRNFADDADQIVIIYTDNLSDIDIEAMLRFHESHDDPITMALFRTPNPTACGIAELNDTGRVVGFEEKPEQPSSDLANAGVYVVDSSAYREIADMAQFDFAFDVLPEFLGRMQGWVWDGYHRDIGAPDDYTQAQKDALRLLEDRSFDEHGHRKAAFLDRDGTLIERVHYLSDPNDVRLLPGVSDGLRRLQRLGYLPVVVTNQAIVGRGIIDEIRLREINDEMCRQLELEGAAVSAIYHCPDVPTIEDRTIIEHENRKPGPGMLLRAAHELNLDLRKSLMIGDMISDVLAGVNADCRKCFLIHSGDELEFDDSQIEVSYHSVPTFSAAVDYISRFARHDNVAVT